MTGRPNEWVNWVHAQSAPPMLPPYHAGAARSRLLRLIEDGHHDVKLGTEAMDKLACWIDLLVPYCGDYTEANVWSDEESAKYEHFLKKRRRMEATERANIAQLIADREP